MDHLAASSQLQHRLTRISTRSSGDSKRTSPKYFRTSSNTFRSSPNIFFESPQIFSNLFDPSVQKFWSAKLCKSNSLEERLLFYFMFFFAPVHLLNVLPAVCPLGMPSQIFGPVSSSSVSECIKWWESEINTLIKWLFIESCWEFIERFIGSFYWVDWKSLMAIDFQWPFFVFFYKRCKVKVVDPKSAILNADKSPNSATQIALGNNERHSCLELFGASIEPLSNHSRLSDHSMAWSLKSNH